MAGNWVDVNLLNSVGKLFCPVCAKEIIDDKKGGFTEDPCDHVLFLYIDLAGIFESHHEELLKKLEKISDESEDYEDLKAKVIEATPDTSVILSIDEPAKGGGHSGSNILIGIDFNEAQPKE